MARKIPVLSTAEVRRVFGDFSFRNTGGGRIEIDPGWVQANIVPCVLRTAKRGADVRTQCHRLAKAPIEAAFEEVHRRGLSSLIRTYDGLWVPRHQLWKDSKPLSRHSWGTAFDLNAEWNPYGGGVSPENVALNEVFNQYGFAWGGDWSPGQRDAMHWELAVLDAAPVASAGSAVPHLIVAAWRDGQWSYHRLRTARLVESRFMVDPAEVAQIANRRLPAGEQPIREVVRALGMKIEKTSDKLSDIADPRMYVFIK